MKEKHSYKEQLNWLSGWHFSVIRERPGCMPSILVLIASIFVLYFLTADTEKSIDQFVYGTVIDSEERLKGNDLIAYIVVKLTDGRKVRVSLPKLVFPETGAKVKLYVDQNSLDENGVFVHKYVDYVN